MDEMPVGPEIPEVGGPLQRDDQHLLGLAEELVQFANAVHDHCAERRHSRVYTALYDLLACSQLLMHYLPVFTPVRAIAKDALTDGKDTLAPNDAELPDDESERPQSSQNVSMPSLDEVLRLQDEGSIGQAYEELESVLERCTELMRTFTFASDGS